MSEEVEQIDEISANLALTASQKADEMRRKASLAGDRETAAKKAQQASNLYKGVAARRARERMAKEEVENVKEESAMSPQEIQLQKRKAQIDKMIAQKRQQALSKAKPAEAPAKAMGEATYPSDFKKGSPVATKKTGRPVQHDQPMSGGRRKTVDESAEDRLRDRRMERGGVDGNVDYRRPARTATGPKKKPSGNSMSAFDKVVGDLKAKYGDKAVMAKKTERK